MMVASAYGMVDSGPHLKVYARASLVSCWWVDYTNTGEGSETNERIG